MFQQLSLTILVILFLAAACIIWYAGVKLVDTTDAIDERWNLGEALGGTIFLAIATNLPEIAIVISAALSGNVGVIAGNLLGGVAIQTVLLVLFDFKIADKTSLTQQPLSLVPALEGLLVIVVLSICIMSTQLPSSLIFDRITPGPLLITTIWIVGIWLLSKANNNLPWHRTNDNTSVSQEQKTEKYKEEQDKNMAKTYLIFIGASAATLLAGVLLERTGNVIADRIGINGMLFGATFLAVSTSLPEISTGLQAVRKGDYELAISDIFGGNAFLPVLFLPATLIAGKAVLPVAGSTNIYLTGLTSLLTSIYLIGLIIRSKRKILRLGIDSALVLFFYIIGMIGLFVIAF
ncbi:hypothetical protein [Fluviicola sp.]|jgi:cation:H+ antiporter|uniref:sodium:calcium antiporter n=1 Tax=Fluviicola sp. TaxID=1917219 RepID=UPI00281F494F|nr:hypothetical protein [Fluviicola sp.]MDR0801934.1 hypothetical protein [Fluviicola sp.]